MKNPHLSNVRRTLAALLVTLALASIVGCDYAPRNALRFATTPGTLEGQTTRVTATVTNVFTEPIIAVSMTLYVARGPAEYFGTRRVIADRDYLKPIMAAEVRDMQTLGRIEADQLGDDGKWIRMPDSRYLHPRILLPGQALTETFEFQPPAASQNLLYCNFFYFRFSSEVVRGRLYARHAPQSIPPNTDRYTEVYTRVDERRLEDPNPQPDNYLLVRPLVPARDTTRLISQRVPLQIRARRFSRDAAAKRARTGASATVYFSAANNWVFQYPDDGTWFVPPAPAKVTKLAGHYAKLISDLEARGGEALALSARRTPDDKLLDFFQTSGYTDPKAADDSARAAIPLDALIPTLQQAEALGYTITSDTWQANAAPPPAPASSEAPQAPPTPPPPGAAPEKAPAPPAPPPPQPTPAPTPPSNPPPPTPPGK